MKSNQSLTSRDLITLGIFNALAIGVYLVVATLTGITVIGLLINSALVALVVGVVYILMAMKVRKKGVFFISGALMGLIGLTAGHIYHALGSVIGGILAEYCAGRNAYRKWWDIACAYVVMRLFDFIGIYLPGFILGKSFLMERGAKFGMSAEIVGEFLKYLTVPTFLILTGLNIMGAFFGAWIGRNILEKHFKKAGLIEDV